MSNTFDKNQNGNVLFQGLEALEGRVAAIEQYTPTTGDVVTHDVPQTLGEYYCVRKALELVAASEYLTNSMTTPTGSGNTRTYNAGDTFHSIPYSSTVVENTFVPNHVSFETFVTALSDPNSYAYSVHPKPAVNAHLYYGCVCTEFACHVLGIKPIIHINAELFYLDGMELVEQDAQAAHIGYLINVEGKNGSYHVRVIVGVTRTNGVVTSITLAEETSREPNTRLVEVTADEFNTLLDTYVMFKYNKLEENTYEPLLSPYKMPIFNKNIMPKKGNKANWSTTENVIIDILDKGDFTQYVVVKDGVPASPVSIGSGTTINLGQMAFGKYSLYLTDGTSKSGAVEWIVVDMNMVAEARAGGIVRFTFSSKNATAIGCAWANPNSYFMTPTFEVTKEDIIKGYKDTIPSRENTIVSNNPDYAQMKTQFDLWNNIYKGNGGKIRPRMMFETEFGIITTDWGTSANNITYIA